jgi:hypothetical protein
VELILRVGSSPTPGTCGQEVYLEFIQKSFTSGFFMTASYQMYISRELTKNHSKSEWEQLLTFHKFTIKNYQHERLIHLIVTMTVGLALLITVVTLMNSYSLSLGVVAVLLLLLFIPYIFHYYQLENRVQGLYPYGISLEEKVLEKSET